VNEVSEAMPANEVSTVIVYPSHWSAARRNALNARYAALLDALTANGGGGAYNRTLSRGAVNRGLIVSETDRTLTAFGRAWRAGYTGTPEPVARIAVTSCGAADNGCKPSKRDQQRAQRIARQLIDGGTLFVQKRMLEVLGMECFYLWSYARTHPDLTTVEQLAAAVHWSLSDTRIRAERCAERGYPLNLSPESEAA
jgi:hypothetical protein